jgi:mitogen-activated protein kinase organizer 1
MSLPVRCSQVYSGHSGSVLVAKFDRNGEYFMSGGADKTIRLWSSASPSSSTPIQGYLGHSWEIADLAIAQDNATFTSCGGDRAVFYWDTSVGRIIRRFHGHHQRINTVAFNEPCNVIASGSYDASVRLWDTRSASSRFPIQVLDDAKDSVSSVHILGHLIMTGSIDGGVRVYDLRQAQMCLDKLVEPVTSVRLTGDTKCLLASCLDSTVRLIDRSDGTVLNTFRGHANKEYRISSTFTPTDSHVLSGSEDGHVYIWDFVSAQVVRKLSGHSATVSSVDYHPTRAACLSASFDGTIRYWS